MTTFKGLMVLVIFTLGPWSPAWLGGALARDHDHPQAPRADSLDSMQRGEDPLQAPRGEVR